MNASVISANVLTTLSRYMSDTAARIVLRTALEGARLPAEALTIRELPRVLEALEPAARHFVSPTQTGALKAALRELVAPKTAPEVLRFDILSEADASRARWSAKTLCEDLGAKSFESQKVATGVSELARNQLSYAGGGLVELHPALTPRRKVLVIAQDKGKGIPDLQLVLSGKYRSKTGMGLGLLGIKRMADAFDAQTGPNGTVIRFEVNL